MSREMFLVTGSSGLIGSALLDRFAGDYRLIGLDRDAPESLPDHASYVKVELGSDESVQSALREVRDQHGDRIASVLHLAAYYDFAGEPSPLYQEITVRGTERLIRSLHELGFLVEQFVFSSTMLVHASCEPGQRINESSVLQPKWDYPSSKVDAERVLHLEHGGIPLVLMRIAGVYDDFGHSIPLAHQIQRIFERRLTSHVYPGDVRRGQSFVHLEDLVEAFAAVVQRRQRLPKEFPVLIGEPETMSYEELQTEIARLIYDEDWETKQIPKALAKTGAWIEDKLPFGEDPFIKPWMIDLADDHYELDISQAEEHLGWRPKHSLRESLSNMVEALKSDPAGWYEAHCLELPARLREVAHASS